jgi:ADP-ribose pyrophosphatase YjhB (NUDIX family)
MSFPFNVRVYGILVVQNRILISHEALNDFHFTKLPGGGLEFGESTRECLIREFSEELDLEVIITDHFYTTDFFVESAFNKKHQVISIYYRVEAKNPIGIDPLISKEIDQRFEWVKLENLSASTFTFPIDKYLAERIANLRNE